VKYINRTILSSLVAAAGYRPTCHNAERGLLAVIWGQLLTD
jgi:hypothetical protein